MSPKPIVAIDGPAGAGKSTVSRRVAERLGYTLLDTGALYRCVALVALREQAVGDAQRITDIAAQLAERGAIRFERSDTSQRVLLDAEDVSEAIRTQEVGSGASKVSAIPGVRAALLEMQRAAGRGGGVVVEGRDIGSVVFPRAEAKFFLTASVEERARRRFEELRERGGSELSFEQVCADVRERDERDSQRPVAPLVRVEDAQLVDSTGLDIDQVVSAIVDRVRDIETRLATSGSDA